VLLAEDNPTNRLLSQMVLERMGYAVEAVASGIDVLNALSRQAYDIVFMDVHMPGMNGLSVTREIRRRFDSPDRPWIVAVTADALREIAFEFARIREAPVSDAELSLATSYLVGVFPIRFETTAEVAGGLATVEIFRLPTNYFDTYRDRVKAVTAQDVLRVAQTHLDPSRLQVIVVGDATAIRPTVEALSLGPVTVYDPADDDVAAAPVFLSSAS
jgi:CheY-like chemotaxis protein